MFQLENLNVKTNIAAFNEVFVEKRHWSAFCSCFLTYKIAFCQFLFKPKNMALGHKVDGRFEGVPQNNGAVFWVGNIMTPN